jgi:hypothetical protein
MKKIIGNEICVFLKTAVDDVPDLSGLLVDVSEDELYIRDTDEVSRLYIVPRDNIKYCTTDVLPTTERAMMVERPTTDATKPNALEVFLDGNLIAQIPVHPTFKTEEFHDGIMQVVYGNPDVKCALNQRVQKSLEYFPGKVYITSEAVHDTQSEGQKPFVMGGYGNISNKFMNPSQMISRLNKTVSSQIHRGSEDDKEKA